MSEISKNRALSTKSKMEALEKLIDLIARYGEIETQLKLNEMNREEVDDQINENQENEMARSSALNDEFTTKIMNDMGDAQQGNQPANQEMV
jgi:flagellar biosynthesis chaperone FliJ